ncbi:MAG: quaternary amine ABC transporter ATP-binding protein [Chloroflexota bacterium]|jgi:glycine betaine/proline transport system ATP-binding protein
MSQVITKPEVEVRGLWKVFGRHPERILASEWRHKSRNEVQKKTGHVIALRDVSFEVAPGETFVIMGLSGSGKSTLVRCLLRLIEPSEGQLFVGGEDILQYSSNQLIQFRRSKAGMIFQRFGLMPHRNVIDNVAFGLELQGVDRRVRLNRAREVLNLVGLAGWENNMPHELSGGMQQRVGLARALAADPEILLMDEPFSALDPLIRREMQDELCRLQKQLKKTIIFITHDLDEALKLGNRIAVMRDGAIVQLGTPEEIVVNPRDDYVSEFTKNIRKVAVLPVRSIMTPPRNTVQAMQHPAVALRAMCETGKELSADLILPCTEKGACTPQECRWFSASNIAFVADGEEKLLGLLTASSAAQAAQQGARQVTSMLEKPPIILEPDTTVEELLGRVVDYDWRFDALPVVDGEGKLVGEVSRETVREVALNLAPDVAAAVV